MSMFRSKMAIGWRGVCWSFAPENLATAARWRITLLELHREHTVFIIRYPPGIGQVIKCGA